MTYVKGENEKIKLAVIGSRSFADKERLFKVLDNSYDRIEMIVSGGANGADSLAQQWAKERGFPCMVYYARWKDKEGNHDKGAGFRRNNYIIKTADKVLCFWDGISRGTAHSIETAEKMGKPVVILKFEEEKDIEKACSSTK